MRSDMHTVLTERPRPKSPMGKAFLRANRRQAHRDPEGTPALRSMKLVHGMHEHGWWLKQHGEHLAPLERFLRSRVGQLWNTVHREMLHRLDCRSVVQNHVLDHVKQLVRFHVILIDGAPHTHVGHRSRPRELWDGELYIDPRTGLLRQHHHRRLK